MKKIKEKFLFYIIVEIDMCMTMIAWLTISQLKSLKI